MGFLFWIHMEHRGKTKPSPFCKSGPKVAQLDIINKAAEWKDVADAGEAAEAV